MRIIMLIMFWLGMFLLVWGITLQIFGWPDIAKGVYSGPVLIIIGLIMLLIRKARRPS